MINVIGSLRIELPGSTLWSKQECFEQLTTEDGRMVEKPIYDRFNHERITVDAHYYDKKAKKMVYRNEELTVHTRKCRPAIQSIPITEDALKGWAEDCPISVNPKVWKAMKKDARILWNLEAIAHDLGGKLLDWYISEE